MQVIDGKKSLVDVAFNETDVIRGHGEQHDKGNWFWHTYCVSKRLNFGSIMISQRLSNSSVVNSYDTELARRNSSYAAHWKSLRIGNASEFWEQHDSWESRVDFARQAGHSGDVLMLVDEAPVAALRAEAYIKAGEALRKAERFRFALEQIERGLESDPRKGSETNSAMATAMRRIKQLRVQRERIGCLALAA